MNLTPAVGQRQWVEPQPLLLPPLLWLLVVLPAVCHVLLQLRLWLLAVPHPHPPQAAAPPPAQPQQGCAQHHTTRCHVRGAPLLLLLPVLG